MLVVTGGWDGTAHITSTELLDLDSMQWSNGPELPYGIFDAVAVPYKNTFLIVGGREASGNNNYYHNTILEFDAGTGDWITRSEQMSQERGIMAAFLVPDDAVNCS